jgi:hypothetical protein
LIWLPGAVTLRMVFGTAGPVRTDGPAWTFLAVAVSVLITGSLGFALAEMGWFSAWLIALLETLGCLGALRVAAGDWAAVRPTAARWLRDLGDTLWTGAAIASGRIVRLRQDARNLRLETFILVGLLLVAAALFARPAEMIRGAADAGVYINAGVALGRTGALVQHDQLMRELLDIGPPPAYAALDEGKEFLQPLNAERYTLARLRMPAFYVLDKQAAMVLPQFYHLYMVWIALCYQLFGLYGALMTTPLLAVLACAAVFFFARQMFSARVALLGLAFLITCPLQIWFARYPVSELPTELLAFLFFFAFLRFTEETRRLSALEVTVGRPPDPAREGESEQVAVRRSARFFAVLAGAALGQICLTRVEFPLYLAPLPFYLLWWRLTRAWRREHTWFVAALGLLLAQWAVHFFFFSFAYTMDQYHNVLIDQRRRWGLWLPVFFLGTAALIALDRLRPRWRPLAGALGSAVGRRRRWLLGALCLGVAAFFAYRYLWEPRILLSADALDALRAGALPFAWQSYIGAPLEAVAQTGKSNQPGLVNTNSFILVRLGWYLSPLGMLLGVVGLVRALWKRLTAGTAYFFAVFAVVGILFSGDTYTVATYPYSLRRFLPVAIPALLVFAAYALAWVAEKARGRRLVRPLVWGAAGALVTFFLVTGWVIISHTEEAGAVAQISALAARFPDPRKTVLLFSNDRDEPYIVATPLEYIFGFNCFSLNRAYGDTKGDVVEGAVRRWQQQGYHVYAVLGANGGKLSMPDLALTPLTQGGPPEWVYNVPELEQLYAQKPKNISASTLPWGLYEVVSRTQTTPPTLPYRLDIGGLDYTSLVAGFSGKEKTHATDPDSAQWRWTFDDAYLRLPWPDAARRSGATVTLRLSAGPATRAVHAAAAPGAKAGAETPLVAAPALVTVSAGGLRQQAVRLTPSAPFTDVVRLAPGAPFTDVSFAVPATAPPDPSDAGSILLHLHSSTWSPAEAGVSPDQRGLGVEVDSVTLDLARP